MGVGAYRLTRGAGEDFLVAPNQEAAFLAWLLARTSTHPTFTDLASKLGDYTPEFTGEMSETALEHLGRRLLESEHLVFLWDGKDAAMESVLLALRAVREDRTAVLPMFGPPNWRGYERAGVDVGFSRTEQIVEDAIAGKIRFLLMAGADLLRDYPDRQKAEQALKAVEHVVQIGLFLPEAAESYHAILPGAGWSEVYGTYANMEGRMQVAKATVQPPGQARPVRTYLASFAHALKKSFVLEPEWDPFDDDSGDFIPKEALPGMIPVPKPEPVSLRPNTLRVVGTSLVIEGGMPSEILEPRVPKYPGRIAPADASRLGISEVGGQILLRGTHGEITLMVAPDARVPEGLVVIPYGIESSPLNQLGDGAVVEVQALEEVSLR
jgi:hypothetical protein